jgi:hypothetical protein
MHIAAAIVVALLLLSGCGTNRPQRSDRAIGAAATPRGSDFGDTFHRMSLRAKRSLCAPMATACVTALFSRNYKLLIETTVVVLPTEGVTRSLFARGSARLRVGETSTNPLSLGGVPGTHTRTLIALTRSSIDGARVVTQTIVDETHSRTDAKRHAYNIRVVADYVSFRIGRLVLNVEFDGVARNAEPRVLRRIISRAEAAQ